MSYANEMEEIVQDFIVEAYEALDLLDQKFVELEKKPNDTDLLNDIFRSVHTIKGASGFLGFTQMVDVTHVGEEILNKLRNSQIILTPDIMDVLLESVDMVKLLLGKIKNKDDSEENIAPIVAKLKEVLEVHSISEEQGKAQASLAKAMDSGEPSTEAQVVEEMEAVGFKDKATEQNIRVDIHRLDNALNLAGELVLSRNRILTLFNRLDEKTNANSDHNLMSEIDEAINQLDLVTTDLQVGVMKMRMQPIARVFNKFTRMVRDLAKAKDKEVDLEIKGEETELDKTVIEEIGDPLVHLVRNSIDHGIELPKDRELHGKFRAATLTLSAFQEGQHIVVMVEDDGRGIDPDKLKEKAIEKNLITVDDAVKMTDKEALELIFMPGFSTADEVTDISGRGVGMDVVKTNIAKINGSVSIESTVGKGTKVIFRLPLTLAIIQALIVEAGGEQYALPLANVLENLRVKEDTIETISGREVANIRNSVISVFRLSQLVGQNAEIEKVSEMAGLLLKAQEEATEETTETQEIKAEDVKVTQVALENEEVEGAEGWKYLVIISVNEKTVGILVDVLHGQEEIVMKSLGTYLKGTEGVAGACITGDGNVILILDMLGLVEGAEKALV